MKARFVLEWRKSIITIIMFAGSLLFLLPFFWMFVTSLKVENEVFVYPIHWLPKQWHAVANYKEVWFGKYPFYRYYWNSIKVSVLTTLISCTVSSLAAYGFSKIQFTAGKYLFMIVLATYMIPNYAVIIPEFILYRYIGLFDSHLGLILLGSFSVLGTFMLRQFFMGVHQEFIESAKIDGAGHFRIFYAIGLPMVKPAVATYAILRFGWTWNDYFNPLIFLRSDKLFTIQLGMQKFTSVSGAFYSLIMAAAVSAILPLLIIFVIGQKNVLKGIAVGGIKG
ncbi:sugar ABC transporter ATP-binding protein [Paenibacillus pectinilyticus]|uniref:Sugar ABC transporter ATP-binding protein n=1 Tax=Paenibacillus pectinilyticus TaxID=512399 RepID=A0A1C0ZT93_9BACL|nr:carbohydrate ABC transporter permease [Paenibacillus pectinilyticus]OCT11277.1 sugar ABC transporter ATP-binding protein [Paenibacillus pectinilyticus]